MCFSSTASFSAAAFLGLSGAVALHRTKHTSHLMFASIPFLFSIQQVAEGVLWTALINDPGDYIQKFSMYVFLFFAQVVWTTWIPLSFFFMEKDRKRRKILHGLSVLGIFASLILCSRLVFLNVSASISDHHIFYAIYSPRALIFINSFLYLVCTIGPCFISSVKRSKLLGTLLMASLIVSELFYELYVISVWCFFAAILSTMIVYMAVAMQEESLRSKLPGEKVL
jgi:hypothetical protein